MGKVHSAGRLLLLFGQAECPHYIYDKMVGGLVDAYVYCGNQAATGHLSRITDWAIRHLDRSRRPATNTETECEWYTLSEE